MNVKYHSYVIVPLKFNETKKLSLEPAAINSMDFTENVKELFREGAPSQMCSAYKCPPIIDEGCYLFEKDLSFRLTESFLFVFKTKVAFLAVGIAYDRIETLRKLRNPGYNESEAAYFYENGQPFDFEGKLESYCRKFGLERFFENKSASFFLDAFTFTMALTENYFESLDILKKYTFNLHQMTEITSDLEDFSEEDVRYVFAVKIQERNAYRWGVCISSQTMSYIFADENMNMAAHIEEQKRDILPIAILALYEKYTCLRFGQLILSSDRKQTQKTKQLMLNFKAYGTINAANFSRWHNVKQVYANLLEVNDIREAISDVEYKINIISESQKEQEKERSDRVMNIITLFGIVSILASVLSIVQILSEGNPAIWISTALTTVVLTLVMVITLRIHK
ncbi:MAG: hypothetical protein J6J83_06480 [Oscillospiraceae bacterium]|nr:hypothetical protein [Oscillospiraceae bacterium]